MMTLQYTTSLLNLIQLFHMKNINFVVDFLGNESLIPRARNRSLEKFRQSDCTHLLFIDSDIKFPAEAILDLLEFDKDVVGCAYPKKNVLFDKLLYSIQNETDSNESLESRSLEFVFNKYDNKLIKNGNFIKVNHIGTGFMLIKRNIIDKLCNKFKDLIITNGENPGIQYALFTCMIKDKKYLSEDYSFCERVIECNGEIWLNINHNLDHIGLYSFNSDIKNRKIMN